MWNQRLDRLQEFPFRRLAALLRGIDPPTGETFDLALGEPRHEPPPLLAETVARHAHEWNRYPPVEGTRAFRAAVCAWLARRYGLPTDALDPDRHVLPLAGTKEGLFLLPQVLVPEGSTGPRPVVLVPNPVYAVYVGAAVLAGAEPVFLSAERASNFLPDLDALDPELLARTAALYLCSPANPQGTIADRAYLARALRLARAYGFLLVVDECYAEIWDREPPPGALEVAWAESRDFANLVVFHSLSKRSSAPGLRSGFVAGDPEVLRRFARLRAYGAAVQPLPLMAAATALWSDEAHVEANRARYRRKIDAAERRLGNRFGFYRPPGGFFLWLEVGDGEAAAVRLWREGGVRALPGAYLAVPDAQGRDPGRPYLRLALVHEEEVLERALDRLVAVLG
ncbi:MAG: aminotransferase class I/II-fold pyridoxal phosphate-dependent enzyme [Geminicoccaceae bacterium]|nr:aminotransferase class I/II-fold pyridoxal phosphate-dependent enzyme [Geminicoccaceae bacterium]